LPRSDTVAIIPVGSCEQHGPHLPYSTDASKEIHAAEAETSLMLTLFSELVKTTVPEQDQRTRSKMLRYFEIEGSGLSAFSWFTSDVSKNGVIGDASKATVEKGAHLLNSSISQLCRKIEKFARAKP